MALTNEDLLAISQLLDAKFQSELQPIRDDIRDIKLDIENDIKPKLRLLAENYVPAAKRYEKAVPRMEAMESDINIMKKVIHEHSQKFQILGV
ncbi:MAG: hypothetical protein HFG62_09530 [Lachnospiraceae bacterium]|nr:hypothetical protein [Lachnospiraceae bacterium]